MTDEIRAVLRPGHGVQLIDLSAGGALVEGSRPLRPGSRVHLQLIIGQQSLGVSARVLRCMVASISADGVRYRGGIAFEIRCEALWERPTRDGYPVPERDHAGRAAYGHDLPVRNPPLGTPMEGLAS